MFIFMYSYIQVSIVHETRIHARIVDDAKNPDLMGGTAKGSADTGVKTGETCLLFTCNSSVDLF
jgi:hypothetical protein